MYQRGRPYSDDVRSRVAQLFNQGHRSREIALQLQISVSTVNRYRRTFADHEGRYEAQPPKEAGGYRHSLLKKAELQELGNILLKHPKLTMSELKQLATEQKLFQGNKVPSDSTIYRAVKKLGLHYGKASFVDPKTEQATGEPLVVYEKRVFRQHQNQGVLGPLNPWNLLFFDESNFSLYDQLTDNDPC